MQKLHDVGTYTFNKEMRNKVGTEDSPFPEEQVVYFERMEVVNRNLIFATAVDPSGTATKGSDFRSVVTFGLDLQRMVFPCMHAWIKRRSVGEMFAAAYAQNDQYPGIVVIEETCSRIFCTMRFSLRQGCLAVSALEHGAAQRQQDRPIVGTCAYLWEHGKILLTAIKRPENPH